MDIFNKFLVGAQGDNICFLKPIPPLLSKEDALLLAAYLVNLSMALKPYELEFGDVIEAVQNA